MEVLTVTIQRRRLAWRYPVGRLCQPWPDHVLPARTVRHEQAARPILRLVAETGADL